MGCGLAIRILLEAVKPLSLTTWLAKLLLPPAEYAPRRILIPFAGTASEGIGAMLAGWDEIVMIEQDVEYCKLAEARLKYWEQQGT
jgi:16S rRNA G966 N2-methylase RsmD